MYFIKLGDSVSQFLNVLLLNGHPNESLSGRAWRTKSIWYRIIDVIFWFDKDHCEMSYMNDLVYAKELLNNKQK